MKVMSINCQNNETNRRGGRALSGYDYSMMLANHILDNDYDFVGTQEMSINFTERLQQLLTDYKFSGQYRSDFKILRHLIPKLGTYRENNKIIIKDKIISEKTIRLPFMPTNPKELYHAIKRRSLMRRIASGALVETKELGKVYIINTHLDYAIKNVQKRQLHKLYNHIYIKRLSYPIILTGDFNLEVGDEIFDNFIKKLEKINIIHVPIFDKTNASKYRNKSAIDHIFISKEYQLVSYGIVEDTNISEITDHKAIYVTFKK